MTSFPPELQSHWAAVSPFLSIRSGEEYDLATGHLHRLMDEIGTDERHPLYTLLDALGTLMHAYEELHHPMPECSSGDIHRFLLEEHGLTQSGLPEIGSQGVVSEILRGKRALNVGQIRALAKRFHLAPSIFI